MFLSLRHSCLCSKVCDILFRCVRQERISIRGFVRRSVRPSVRQSVCPLRKCKNRISWLFLATVRSYIETNDQPTCFESPFTRLFVHLSLHTFVTWSIHAETQPGRIVARSGLFSLLLLFSHLFLFKIGFIILRSSLFITVSQLSLHSRTIV